MFPNPGPQAPLTCMHDLIQHTWFRSTGHHEASADVWWWAHHLKRGLKTRIKKHCSIRCSSDVALLCFMLGNVPNHSYYCNDSISDFQDNVGCPSFSSSLIKTELGIVKRWQKSVCPKKPARIFHHHQLSSGGFNLLECFTLQFPFN